MIDWDRIAELTTEVGEGELAELLDIFFEEVEETIENLLTDTGPIDAETMHFLKGSAANIGMSELKMLCEAAETALAFSPQSNVDLTSIDIAFRKARQELCSTRT